VSLYKDSERWLNVGLFLAKMPWTEGKPRNISSIKQWARECWLENGYIMRRKRGCLPVRVIGRKKDQDEILAQLHEEHGHRGVKATYVKTADRFYWDGMLSSVKHWVKTCGDCQARDHRNFEDVRRHLDVPTIFGKISLDCVYMPESYNFIGPLNFGERRESYIVLARDDLSGWVEGMAVPDLKAETIAKFFFENIVCRFGLIGHVSTDNGPEFMGAFHECLVRYGIAHIRTSSYHPEGNGMIERGHGPLKEALFKLMRTRGRNWVVLLPYVLWADRTTAKRTTRHTPHYMLYGQESILPIDAEYETFLVGNWKSHMTTEELLVTRARQLERLPEDVALAHRLVQEERERSVLHHNAGMGIQQREVPFKVGELVLVRNAKQEQSHSVKVEDRYLGPYRVRKLGNQNSVFLEELDGTPVEDKALAHIGHNRLRRFYSRYRFDVEVNPLADPNPHQPVAVRKARKRQRDRQYPPVYPTGALSNGHVLRERIDLGSGTMVVAPPHATQTPPARSTFLPSEED
jgi:hypothetical protein